MDMSLVLTDEQELIKQAAAEFLKEKSPVGHLRELRDSQDPVGFSKELWKEMAGLGWAGIPFDEAVGGAGLGLAELGVLLEECGRTLAPYPFLSTVVLGGSAVMLGGSEALKSAILPGVCRGETLLALAFQETGRFSPWAIDTKAEQDGEGYRISGEKIFVLDGHVADHLVVAARTSGSAGEREGITLFWVDPAARGCTVTRTIMVDSRNAARVALSDVTVAAGSVLGEVGWGADILDKTFDRAAALLSAEMVGLIGEVFSARWSCPRPSRSMPCAPSTRSVRTRREP
jgi:alkylation response protein AidB-like acyl-CoA dehydrogenase